MTRTRLDDDIERACQAIYRERNGYWPNESERARIAIAVEEVTATHTAEAWLDCSCGKTYRKFYRETSQQSADLMVKVAEMGICRACSADSSRAIDRCPESTDQGACKLGWAHTGRCEPYPDVPEFVRRAAALNEGMSLPVPDEGTDPSCNCGHAYSRHATKGLLCDDCDCERLDFSALAGQGVTEQNAPTATRPLGPLTSTTTAHLQESD